MSGGPIRDAAVIGAGVAGLGAAWELVSAGVSVTIYERDPEPGGLLRTDRLDGALVDPAVQLLGSYYRETFRLAEEVGAANLLVRAPGWDALWRGGRSHGISYGSVISLAGSSALPAALKFRLASRYLSFLRRHAGLLDPADPVRAVSLDGESIATWGHRELGADFVELLVYPQLAAYYGSTPEETSAGFYHGLARAGLDLRLYGVRGGMGELAAAIVRALERGGARFRTGIEVGRVEAESSGVRVEWGGGEARHDSAILAVPAPVASEITALAGPLRSWLAGVRYAEEVAVALLLDRPLPNDYFGLSFPRLAPPGESVAAFCAESRKDAGLAGAGREVLLAVPAPTAMADFLAATPREALNLVLPSVELVYPGLSERIVRARSYRFPDGRVIFYPGYLQHLSRFDQAWQPARLALAGDYLISPTVEGALRSGRRAAAYLLRGR